MKRWLPVLLVLLLLLTGCQPSQELPADDGTTNRQTTEESFDDTTQDSSKDVTVDSPDDDPIQQPLKAGDSGSHSRAPSDMYSFVHCVDMQHPLPDDIDATGCIAGNLYVQNKNTGKLFQITEEAVSYYHCRGKFMLYVTEREPQKVWRTDYTGSSHTVVYEASYGDITQVECYDNVGEKGQLAILEGSTHIVLYDFATTQSQVLVTQQDIDHFDLSLYGRKGYVGFRKKDWSRWYYDTVTGELMEDTSL